ncbi:MAG: type II secretion system protein [Verrucomicrobiota bacterium]
MSWLKQGRVRTGFTLIELLVVIAIIGILAALITNLAGPASDKKKRARVETEMSQIVIAIESYKEKRGSYPPCNGNTNNAVTNQLFYELTGTVNIDPNFQTINGSETIATTTIQSFFNTQGFANSSTDKSEVKNFFPGLKSTQYAEISSTPDVEVLNVPVDGPNDIILPNGKKLNPWRYNSITPTHNPESYDLWAEILVGGKTEIIGNWKK